jgi:hypothetical protein
MANAVSFSLRPRTLSFVCVVYVSTIYVLYVWFHYLSHSYVSLCDEEYHFLYSRPSVPYILSNTVAAGTRLFRIYLALKFLKKKKKKKSSAQHRAYSFVLSVLWKSLLQSLLECICDTCINASKTNKKFFKRSANRLFFRFVLQWFVSLWDFTLSIFASGGVAFTYSARILLYTIHLRN